MLASLQQWTRKGGRSILAFDELETLIMSVEERKLHLIREDFLPNVWAKDKDLKWQEAADAVTSVYRV